MHSIHRYAFASTARCLKRPHLCVATAAFENLRRQAACQRFYTGGALAKNLKIKLDFVDEQGGKVTEVWRPEEEYLHEAFQKAGAQVNEYDIYYVDREGDRLQLEVSMARVEDMLGEIEQPGRLTIHKRPPVTPGTSATEQALQGQLCGGDLQGSSTGTQPGGGRGGSEPAVLNGVAEAVTRAWRWMTGGGKANEEEVQKVQSEVETKGGRIVSNSDAAALINYAGCDLGKWDEVVNNLALQLDLDDKSKAGLWNAQFLDDGESMQFHDTVERGVRTTTYMAYRTVRDEDRQKIHVIYGRHQLSMEALEPGAAFPMGNCIQLGDRTFTVLPPASPHVNALGTEVKDQWFEVPAGWRVCNASADDWGDVVASVIRPYYWSTDQIVGQQDQQFPAWNTACNCMCAGDKSHDNVTWFTWDPHQRRGRFASYSARLLIEKTPHTSFELLQDWKRFVRLSAQAEWSSRLAPPTPAEES